jgi:hypothetical protein
VGRFESKNRQWNTEHQAASRFVVQFNLEFADWQFVNSMGSRCFGYLIPSILLLTVIGFGLHLGDRAFWVLVFPLGLVSYPLLLIQAILLFVMWRSFQQYRSILDGGFETPPAIRLTKHKEAQRKVKRYTDANPNVHSGGMS